MFLALLASLLTVSCGAPQTDKNTGSAPPKTASGQTKNGQAEPGPSDFAGRYESFAQAHDAFTTTLPKAFLTWYPILPKSVTWPPMCPATPATARNTPSSSGW